MLSQAAQYMYQHLLSLVQLYMYYISYGYSYVGYTYMVDRSKYYACVSVSKNIILL